MKIGIIVSWAVAAVLCLCNSSTLAGPVDQLVCKRVAGGPMASFHITIDFDAKEIDVPSSTGLQPDTESVEITITAAKWSFMRGFVDLDRRSGELDWNTTAEYAYLEAIDQPAQVPELDFRGRMQCDAHGGPTSH